MLRNEMGKVKKRVQVNDTAYDVLRDLIDFSFDYRNRKEGYCQALKEHVRLKRRARRILRELESSGS